MSPFTKHRLKKIARSIGFAGRLGDPVRRDMGSFCRHLAHIGFRPRTIIDVGVADGTLEIYEAFPQARMILVEPVEAFRGAINQLLSRYEGECHYVAAGPENGEADFAIGEHFADLHGARFAPDGNGRRIPMRRLDELASGATGPILLKVDVEGFELSVMKGATSILPEVEVVILETRLFDVLGGQSVMHEVVGAMAEQGYAVYDVLNTMARPLDGALVLCDLAFVRFDSSLRADNRFATDEQASAFDRKFRTRLRRFVGV